MNFNSMILELKEKAVKRPTTSTNTKIQHKKSAKASSVRIKSANVELYRRTDDHLDTELGIVEDLHPDNQFYNQTEN